MALQYSRRVHVQSVEVNARVNARVNVNARVCADLSFVLANARVVEWPIVFANESFCKLVGFGRTEIMMKSALCPFLQGARTDPRALVRLQTACEQQLKDQIELLFYKKNSALLTSLDFTLLYVVLN